MLLLLTACSDTKKFVGTWSSELELKDALVTQISSETDADAEAFLKYFSIDSFSLTMVFEFEQDKSFVSYVDAQSLETAMANVKSALGAAMYSYLEEVLTQSAAENGYTLDTLMQLAGAADLNAFVEMAMGMSIDSFVESAFSGYDLGVVSDGFEMSGTYEANGGKLTLTTESGETNVELYELSGDAFQLLSTENDEQDTAFVGMENLYPLTFTKIA